MIVCTFLSSGARWRASDIAGSENSFWTELKQFPSSLERLSLLSAEDLYADI
jgi:hypothetical protein